MKTIPFVAAVLLLAGCKQAEVRSVSETGQSSATAEKAASAIPRKFIRTAGAKFRVKDVVRSTDAIEHVVTAFGGFVSSGNLRSETIERNDVKVSLDSTLQTTRYVMANDLTLRVPVARLDTVMRMIVSQADFLDFRVTKTDDVALVSLSNALAQRRNENHRQRLADDIDRKGRKLVDITTAENEVTTAEETRDNATIENLSLDDKAAFSTVTLSLYQPETVRQELIANARNVSAYRPHIGLQVWDSAKTGWFILESIVAFVVQLWSLALLALVGILIFRRYVRRTKVETI